MARRSPSLSTSPQALHQRINRTECGVEGFLVRCLSPITAIFLCRLSAYGCRGKHFGINKSGDFRPATAAVKFDIEAFEGTCYKAAGWQPCGITKGFTREHRADYFFRNNRPKKLWLRPLNRNAGTMLCHIEIPPEYAAGLNLISPERALPLRAAQMESLRDVLRQVPDPRASNRKFPCSSLLLLVALGLLAGRKSLAAIQRYGQLLTQKQRPAPSYSALYNLLCKTDPHGFARFFTLCHQPGELIVTRDEGKIRQAGD
jgi:hypothetical protein